MRSVLHIFTPPKTPPSPFSLSDSRMRTPSHPQPTRTAMTPGVHLTRLQQGSRDPGVAGAASRRDSRWGILRPV